MKEKGELEKKGKRKFFTKKVTLIMVAVIIVILGGTGVGLVKAADNPAMCAVCHNMDDYYNSYNEEGLLAHKHAEADVTCHDCHTEPITESINKGVKYITANYEEHLEKRDFGTREFCLECHDFDEVKTNTNFEESNPHDSHNGEMECNVCHNMHQESEVMCQECHTFDWMTDLDESWRK